MGSIRHRDVACSASDCQGTNFEYCVRRAVSSHHHQEVLLARFSLYMHIKCGIKSHPFHVFYVKSGFIHSSHYLMKHRSRARFTQSAIYTRYTLLLLCCMITDAWQHRILVAGFYAIYTIIIVLHDDRCMATQNSSRWIFL